MTFAPWGVFVAVTMSVAPLAPGSTLTGQESPGTALVSPVKDLTERANASLSNLKYDEALGFARAALAQRRIQSAQRLELYQLLAAAFFPDPQDGGRNPQADSAAFYLRLAIQLQADLRLAEIYRWPGIDSLFRETRAGTVAFVARPSPENALTGTDGRAHVEVVTTRPAAMYLRARSARDGTIVTHDSSIGSTRARLALRAHDGASALFAAGDYEILVEVRDEQTAQTIARGFPARASGSPPTIDPSPILNPFELKPERAPKALAKGITAGLLIGAATVALSSHARAEKPIRSTFSPDGRARVVGLAIAAGAITGGILDRGRPLPGNVAANLAYRADHAGRVALVRDSNRKRVGDYHVVLRIDLDGER